MYCPHCGGEFQTPQDGACPHCGNTVHAVPPAVPGGGEGQSLANAGVGGGGGAGAPPPAAEQPYCPFEDPNLGFFDGLVETIKQVFAHPIQFFRRLPDTSDIGKAVLFYLLLTLIGSFFQAAWSLISTPLQSDPEEMRQILEQLNLPPEFVDSFVQSMGGSGAVGNAVTQIFLGPIIGLIAVLILSGIYHLLLMMFGGANRDYGGTFRVVAYTAALQLLMVVPMCGPFISAIWGLVLYCVGLAAVHRTDGWKAVVAVLLPIVLCCLCCAGALFAFAGVIAGASG